MTDALLIHGFTHTGASWDRVISALDERYRALAPDLRGHGAASDAQPVTLTAVLADLANAATAPYVLAGYSMGGRVGLHLALRAPDRVKRLVLIGASPGIADEAEREQRRCDDERLAGQIETMRIEEFARMWAQTPLLAGLSDEVAARVHADRLRSKPEGLARALRGLGTAVLPSLWDRLGDLEMPVTLVAGQRDTKFRQIAEAMAAAMANAEVVVVEGTGHAVHLEAPDRVAGIVNDHPRM